MKKAKPVYLLVFLVVLVLVGYGAYTEGLSAKKTSSSTSPAKTSAAAAAPSAMPLLKDQTAVTTGKIVNVDTAAKTVAFVGDNSQTAEFKLADNFAIDLPTNTATSKLSSDPKDIILGREALVTLKVDSGEYKVYRIEYYDNTPPPSSPPRSK